MKLTRPKTIFGPIALGLALGATVVIVRRSGASGGSMAGDRWTMNDGVILTPKATAFLRKLQARLPVDVPLHVTSGKRTAREQAQAMMRKYELGGAPELFATYANDAQVSKLLSLGVDLDKWTEFLETNGRAFSRHVDPEGLGIDLRSHNLTPDQVVLVTDAVKALGGRSLVEGTPAHIHVDVPG